MKKKIVLSGINFYAGGPLSVFRDCLKAIGEKYSDEYEIIALVYKKELFKDIKNIEVWEFPTSRRNWIIRLYYEYHLFKKISKKLKPYIWISMHDITPNIIANKRVVYCHNPMPFYKMNLREMRLDYKLALFNLFYKYIYKININKNNFVVVQQQWLRDEFCKKFNLNHKNIIVATPEIKETFENRDVKKEKKEIKSFFYPTFPRVFKNIELICEACKILEIKGVKNFEVYITISGNENKYSKWILKKYNDLKTVKFIGQLNREEVFKYYEKVDALIFPSKIETWGLPITEFKKYNKPIIIADTNYAKETAGVYDKLLLIDKNLKENLSQHIERIIQGQEKKFFKFKDKIEVKEPKSNNWEELFNIIVGESEND